MFQLEVSMKIKTATKENGSIWTKLVMLAVIGMIKIVYPTW